MQICFRCNAVNPLKLSDHKPECPLLQDKKDRAKSVTRIVERFSQRNKRAGDPSLGRINRPGACKQCGEKVANLLTHLRTCRQPAP